jgi:hypothetical protein
MHLSHNAQARGRRLLLSAMSFNPLGASLAMGPVIQLLALHYGAGDLAMGLIYAAIHVTAAAAILTPLLLNGVDVSRIVARSWLIRAFVGLVYLCLPLLPSDGWKVGLLIGTLYVFASIRSLGVAAVPAQMRALANNRRDITKLSADAGSKWHTGYLIASVISFLVLRHQGWFPSEEFAFLLLLGIGGFFNIVTGSLLFRVPNTGRMQGGSLVSVAQAAQLVFSIKAYREVVLVSFLQVMLLVTSGYQLSDLKGPQGFSPEGVFGLLIASIVASLLATRLLSLLGDRISFRGLLICTHALLATAGLIWLSVPQWPADVQGTLAGSLYIGSMSLLAFSGGIQSAMTGDRLPGQLRMQVSIVYQMGTVLAALCGLGLCSLLGQLLPADWNPYAFAYLPWIGLSLGLCGWALRNPAPDGPALLAELRQLTPANIHVLWRLQRLDNTQDPTRVRFIERLMSADTPASHERLINCLCSPDVKERLSAYRSLLERIDPEALPMVLGEAQNIRSPLRAEALTVLGLSGEKRFIEPLQKLLTNEIDERIHACAIKSLLRLGADMDDEHLLKSYQHAHDYRNRFEILIGLAVARRCTCLEHLLREECHHDADPVWLGCLLLNWADACGDRQRIGRLLALEQEEEGAGIRDLLTEAAESEPEPWQSWLQSWNKQGLQTNCFQQLDHLLPRPIPGSIALLAALLIWHRAHRTAE